MKDNLPNFLVVGAAKCATTSLYYYLKQHPQIYMSPRKEPHFFVYQAFTSPPFTSPLRGTKNQVGDVRVVKSLKEYESLFSGVKNETKIGEASTSYLYFYKEAIPNIKAVLGDVKIIVILRSPIDRAYSAYMHAVRDGRENLSFENALRQEKQRIEDNCAPIWRYVDYGFYHEQVKAYLANFSFVKICLFEDLERDRLALLQEVYDFINVETSFVPKFDAHYNTSGVAKYKLLHRFITRPNVIKSMMKGIVVPIVGPEKKIVIREKLRRCLLKKPEMKKETRKHLRGVFRENVLALQALIQRDLTYWLE